VTFCFEPQRSHELNTEGEHTAHIVTADCMHPIHPLVQTFINRNSTLNKVEREFQRKRKFQSFSFLTEDGDEHKLYGSKPQRLLEKMR
jgi:hypothetical protein